MRPTALNLKCLANRRALTKQAQVLNVQALHRFAPILKPSSTASSTVLGLRQSPMI